MNSVWKFFSEMPSTNVRIAMSIIMALATAVRVVFLGWEPSYQWLGFLVIWAGLDVAQFSSKRNTDADFIAAKQGNAPPGPSAPPQVGV